MDADTYTINYKSDSCCTEIKHIYSVSDLIDYYKPGDLTNTQRHLFVTDATVASLETMKEFISKFDEDVCGNDVLFVLGSGEPYKTIDTVMSIIEIALKYNFSTEDVFVGIGGGVICDTTAFAASIYKRGINLNLIPTTLVCIIDSCIGGKTSCNFQKHKNIVGTYYPASKVFINTEFVKTLNDSQYKSGLAESFKTSLLADNKLYETFKEKVELIKNHDEHTINVIINKTLETKAKIVEQDMKDQNIRKYLNLGHTFAYALETVVGMGVITHGEAVAWGIGRAISISYNKGYCTESFKDEILALLETYGYEINSVPAVVIGGGIGERILNAMHTDKKTLGNTIRLIVPKAIGTVAIEDFEDSEILAVLK